MKMRMRKSIAGDITAAMITGMMKMSMKIMTGMKERIRATAHIIVAVQSVGISLHLILG